MKKITILGATGSIGQQTVDVCLHHQDEFEVVAVSAGKNIKLLLYIALCFILQDRTAAIINNSII